jgi:hypothetical protein
MEMETELSRRVIDGIASALNNNVLCSQGELELLQSAIGTKWEAYVRCSLWTGNATELT